MKPSRFDSLPICSNLKSHPSINDLQWDLASKTHGYVDVSIGLKAPAGKENSWVRIASGKGWYKLWRVYGPLQLYLSVNSKQP